MTPTPCSSPPPQDKLGIPLQFAAKDYPRGAFLALPAAYRLKIKVTATKCPGWVFHALASLSRFLRDQPSWELGLWACLYLTLGLISFHPPFPGPSGVPPFPLLSICNGSTFSSAEDAPVAVAVAHGVPSFTGWEESWGQ